jgi:hypothetical protein
MFIRDALSARSAEVLAMVPAATNAIAIRMNFIFDPPL